MKINSMIFAEKIMEAPDACMGMSDEKKKSKQMLLLLAGDRRMEKLLSLSDISEMFTNADMLLDVIQRSNQSSFSEELLVDCARGMRRAV